MRWQGTTYGGVSERAFGDCLKKRRLAHIRKTNDSCRRLAYVFFVLASGERAGLQIVSRASEEELFLLDILLWRHLLLFGVGSCGGEKNRAAKQALVWCWGSGRSSCRRPCKIEG